MPDRPCDIVARVPEAADGLALNEAFGGWKTPHLPSLEQALAGSLACFCALDGGKLVGPMAAPGAEAFYKRFGFRRRPGDRPGMDRAIRRDAPPPGRI